MAEKQKRKRANPQDHTPDAEVVAAELANSLQKIVVRAYPLHKGA